MRPADPESWRADGRTFDYAGHDIFYAEQGDRASDTALLLIHGFPTSSWDWHRLWDALGARFARVIAPDMIGFGFSAKPKAHAYSILDQATLHEQLLAARGIKRVHILAHDYGDTVAQELLARQLDGGALCIESCVLLNGGLFPETHRARLVQKLLLTPLGPLLARLMGRSGFDRSFSAVFGAGTRPTDSELADFWSLILREDGHLLFPKLIAYMPERVRHRARWVGALQETRVPLRVIDGADDPVSGAHMVARYRELVPNPDAVLLPGIGHYPQLEDRNGVLKAFFELHERVR